MLKNSKDTIKPLKPPYCMEAGLYGGLIHDGPEAIGMGRNMDGHFSCGHDFGC